MKSLLKDFRRYSNLKQASFFYAFSQRAENQFEINLKLIYIFNEISYRSTFDIEIDD